jgi:pre-rRNA-processing protein TSR3
MKQDDPRKCTAAKLVKFRLAVPLFRLKQVPGRAIILNPFATRVLLSGDSALAGKYGIVAIDCSWEKVENAFTIQRRGEARRLPPLLASNPVNYAKMHKLSSVEALAAALHIMGFKDAGFKLLSLFKWGDSFFTLNAQLFEEYAKAVTEEDVVRVQASFF